MSLPNKERLQDAVAFLKSLDLSDLLREADRVARERGEKSAKKARTTQSQAHPQPQQPASEALPPVSYNSQATPQLLRVSLESLHALPRAKAATVLHASPVDPTGRLYPFCVMLRDKFIEAGFVLNESKNEMPNKPSDSAVAASPSPSSQCKYMPGDDKPTLKEQPGSPAEKSKSELTAWHTHADPYTAALARKPKPRPLLLHATLVNTIYVRGRSKPKNRNGKNGQNGSKRLEFDARDILQRYRNYFVDQARTIAADDSRTEVTTSVLEISSSAETRLTSSQGVECVSDTGPLTPISQPLYPFVWARDIPIDSVCICEMGAKKLEIGGGDDDGLNARLGENYTVVAEQKIELDL
ncbi:hypothetical protein N7539_005253 [Penicillium diatomitis]|uniref:Uncharacterized protein n=1 Tax=Penicillium diatomitis TaxID=2819901 RepID=A0A9X0BV48_9EURO|nr:uncharacterized protein N7539_005253 [Penicillium diatomitis]KAJ5485265.1 hypothetical protein N7539_005253 [Penicillium diatomitis]